MATFLTAEWRALLMLNYLVQPALLQPLVPTGTELDTWNQRTYISLVGFRFENTRVLGVAVPWHSAFEEVNLRFYVRREAEDGWRRGVVFIREIVPKRAVAAMARWIYGEPYTFAPMRHTDHPVNAGTHVGRDVSYGWHMGGRWNSVRVLTAGPSEKPEAGSEAEFITEHYWGYTALPDGRAREYRVTHPQWNVQAARVSELDCDVAAVYGSRYAEALAQEPASAFLADGSAIVVQAGAAVTRPADRSRP